MSLTDLVDRGTVVSGKLLVVGAVDANGSLLRSAGHEIRTKRQEFDGQVDVGPVESVKVDVVKIELVGIPRTGSQGYDDFVVMASLGHGPLSDEQFSTFQPFFHKNVFSASPRDNLPRIGEDIFFYLGFVRKEEAEKPPVFAAEVPGEICFAVYRLARDLR